MTARRSRSPSPAVRTDGSSSTSPLGNLQAAREQLSKLLPHLQENEYPDQAIYQYTRSLILPVAEPLLADDRPALARILHGWEPENIRRAKLDPYWEPTPFPLEQAST